MDILKLKKNFLSNPVFYIVLFVVYLLPFLDGGTSFLSDLVIFFLPLPLFLIGLVTRTLNFKNLPKKIVFAWLVFLGFVLVSTFYSGSKIVSVPELFRFLAYFLYFVLFLLTVKKSSLRDIFALLLIVSGGLIILSFLSLCSGIVRPVSEMNLFYANYGHNHLADYMLLVIPFLVSLFFFAKDKKSLLMRGGLTIFYVLCFMLTFSRGAYLILPIVVTILFFLIKPKDTLKRGYSVLVTVIPVVLLIVISLLSYRLPLKDREILTSKSWLVRQIIKPDFDGKRIYYWRQAWDGFLSQPWFGYGIGTYSLVAIRFQRQESNWSSYAHNFYLQLLSEVGIFSLLSFFWILFIIIKKAWRVIHTGKDPLKIGAFGAILASSLHSIIDYDWHFPAVFITFWLIVASIIQPDSEKKVSRIMLWQKMMICLSFIVFVFGLAEIQGNYLYKKNDWESVWWLAPVANDNLRKVVESSFRQDLSKGDKISEQLIALAPKNPSLYFWLGDSYYSLGQLKKAQELYYKSIELNPMGGWQLYLKLVEIDHKLTEEGESDRFQTFLVDQLSRGENFEDFSVGFGKTAYWMGFERYKEEDKNGAVFWWDKSIQVLPQWSYYHLELASLYQSMGQTAEAGKVLENCLRFEFPREHCLNYIEAGEVIELEPPGYWQQEILTIPQYQR